MWVGEVFYQACYNGFEYILSQVTYNYQLHADIVQFNWLSFWHNYYRNQIYHENFKLQVFEDRIQVQNGIASRSYHPDEKETFFGIL